MKEQRSRKRSSRLRRSKVERPGPFPAPDRFTVSGLLVGDVCFTCECRVFEIAGGDGVTLAWCECAWPEDHHGMEVI